MSEVPNILLSGVVGSTAYGLAHAGSDVDRLGMYALPTTTVLGLGPQPLGSVVTVKPDAVFHEARKFVLLALRCNPTVSELLWLDDYEAETVLGRELVGLRTKLLSRELVRNAYLGYAIHQFQKLTARGDGSFSADTRLRTAKHARHLKRLCFQGFELYATGVLHIKLDHPQEFVNFGERVAQGDTEVARQMIGVYEDKFNRTTSVLPEHPNQEAANAWLLRVRREYLTLH